MTKREREAFVAQLQSYLPELKAEIDAAKDSLRDARTKKTQLEGIITASEELLDKLNSPTEGVEAKLTAGSDIVTKVADLESAAKTQLDTIENETQSISDSINEMESAYTEFVALKAKVDDPTTGMAAAFEDLKRIRANAQGASTRTDNLLADADKALTKVNKYIVDIDTAYTEFIDLKKKVDDPTEGMSAALESTKKLRDRISGVAEKSDTLFASISGYKDEASVNVDSIKASKTEADDELSKIREHESTSKTTRDKISEIYELVSQTGHASRFDGKAKDLETASWIWFTVGVLSVLLAVSIAHFWIAPLFPTDTSKGITSTMAILLLLRALIVSPVIILAVIAFRHFGSDRRQSDQYAFKAVSAATLEGSIRLVKGSTDGVAEKELAGFAIETATKLHTEPQELQKVTRFNFSIKHKLADVGAELNDTLESIDNGVKQVVEQVKGPTVNVLAANRVLPGQDVSGKITE